MITLRLPHPFGVCCTCTPVELLTVFQGDYLEPRLVSLVVSGLSSFERTVSTEKVKLGKRLRLLLPTVSRPEQQGQFLIPRHKKSPSIHHPPLSVMLSVL